jgi:hypothetical protein
MISLLVAGLVHSLSAATTFAETEAIGTVAASRNEPSPPHLRAYRTHQPPMIDGRLDDPVWKDSFASQRFRQKFPREGDAPDERTSLRIAYDDEALYVAFDCEQRTAINDRLTRRDRTVESDWVSVAIDTRRDGKTAFEFTVNAGGVLIDSIRFNDTDVSADWDENWDARTATTPGGWSAELRIPLRILRFVALPVQSWGLQARRYVSDRQETDEWAFIPRSSAGEVSQYGHLDDLSGLRSGGGLELSPFVLGRYRRRDAQMGQLASGTDYSESAGLDLKLHPSQELTVDVALNPDFAQVESDQVILNLTNFEINYPEKRRFFLEGIDTFAMPSVQLLYTRRIGRAAAAPALPQSERAVDVPEPAAIYGAAKVIGQLGSRWEVGALSAVTARNEVDAQIWNGTREPRAADPLSLYNVLRLKRSFSDNGHLGMIATAVNRLEQSSDYPVRYFDPQAPRVLAFCPDGSYGRPGQRCFSDAYAGGIDWRWRSSSGDYVTAGQVMGSLLEQGPPRPQADGTIIDSGNLGGAFFTALSKEGGDHWLWNAYAEGANRKFDVNDLGFSPRGNYLTAGGEIAFRTLEPWAKTLETLTRIEVRASNNTKGVPLDRMVQLDTRLKFKNFWSLWMAFHYWPAHFDDREVGDGAALERAARVGHEMNLTTDPRAALSVRLTTVTELLEGAFNTTGELGLVAHALPRLDLELIPQVFYARGEPRFASGGGGGAYLFGRLEARSLGLTLRTTLTFTPRLTLQTYAQFFVASKHFSHLSSFDPASVEGHAVIHLYDLRPVPGEPKQNPDTQEGSLDVNVVLRWEFIPGSLLYLVYTRSQAPHLILRPGQRAILDLYSVPRGPAADVVLIKLSYWWG